MIFQLGFVWETVETASHFLIIFFFTHFQYTTSIYIGTNSFHYHWKYSMENDYTTYIIPKYHKFYEKTFNL